MHGERRLRDRYFEASLFRDAIWDIALDLFASASEGLDVSITSACLATSVPQATALRHLERMERCGMIVRYFVGNDRRCAFVRLSPNATATMCSLLKRMREARSRSR